MLSEDYAKIIIDSKLDIKCQYAIDTGMNRIGLDANDPNRCSEFIHQASHSLNLTGIFTHLCTADSIDINNKSFTELQIKKFVSVSALIEDLHLPFIHCLNSAGGLWYNRPGISSAVRLGIILVYAAAKTARARS